MGDRYSSPPSPFLDSFRLADDSPATESITSRAGFWTATLPAVLRVIKQPHVVCDQQIYGCWPSTQLPQERSYLAAMVGLVIDEMNANCFPSGEKLMRLSMSTGSTLGACATHVIREMASSETIQKLEVQNRNLGIFVLLGSFSRKGRCSQTSLLEM
jgi:hypothetical protein